MDVNEISQSCEIGSVSYIKKQIQDLIEEYKEKNSALEIQEHEGRYKLNIRKQYGYLANKLLGDGEMDSPTTKTLAIIAYKNPVLQSDIIKIRGNKAYDHISVLVEQGLINKIEKRGRSRVIKLTQKFFEYFDIAEHELKNELGGVEKGIKEKVAWKMGINPKEVEEQVILQNLEKKSDGCVEEGSSEEENDLSGEKSSEETDSIKEEK